MIYFMFFQIYFLAKLFSIFYSFSSKSLGNRERDRQKRKNEKETFQDSRVCCFFRFRVINKTKQKKENQTKYTLSIMFKDGWQNEYERKPEGAI